MMSQVPWDFPRIIQLPRKYLPATPPPWRRKGFLGIGFGGVTKRRYGEGVLRPDPFDVLDATGGGGTVLQTAGFLAAAMARAWGDICTVSVLGFGGAFWGMATGFGGLGLALAVC